VTAFQGNEKDTAVEPRSGRHVDVQKSNGKREGRPEETWNPENRNGGKTYLSPTNEGTRREAWWKPLGHHCGGRVLHKEKNGGERLSKTTRQTVSGAGTPKGEKTLPAGKKKKAKNSLTVGNGTAKINPNYKKVKKEKK